MSCGSCKLHNLDSNEWNGHQPHESYAVISSLFSSNIRKKKQKNVSKARDMATNLKKKSVPGSTPDLYIWHFVLVKFVSQNSNEANMLMFQPTLTESALKSLFFFRQFQGTKTMLDHQTGSSSRVSSDRSKTYIIKESTLKRIHPARLTSRFGYLQPFSVPKNPFKFFSSLSISF